MNGLSCKAEGVSAKLRQDILDHASGDAGQPKIAAIKMVRELLVLKAE
jgi:hypothetical protein